MSNEVGAEAGDGEKPGEGGQPSVEPLNGERKTMDDHPQLAGKHSGLDTMVDRLRNNLEKVY